MLEWKLRSCIMVFCAAVTQAVFTCLSVLGLECYTVNPFTGINAKWLQTVRLAQVWEMKTFLGNGIHAIS